VEVMVEVGKEVEVRVEVVKVEVVTEEVAMVAEARAVGAVTQVVVAKAEG